MILPKSKINKLSKSTKVELLNLLYTIEDELCYTCKTVSKTIDYLQDLSKESV